MLLDKAFWRRRIDLGGTFHNPIHQTHQYRRLQKPVESRWEFGEATFWTIKRLQVLGRVPVAFGHRNGCGRTLERATEIERHQLVAVLTVLAVENDVLRAKNEVIRQVTGPFRDVNLREWPADPATAPARDLGAREQRAARRTQSRPLSP